MQHADLMKKMQQPGYDWASFERTVLLLADDYQLAILARVQTQGHPASAQQAREMATLARTWELHRDQEKARAIE